MTGEAIDVLKKIVPDNELEAIIMDVSVNQGFCYRVADQRTSILEDGKVRYNVEIGEDNWSKWGEGGSRLRFLKLVDCDGKIILRSYSFDQYVSNFDESMAWSEPTEYGTELYVEDCLGREVFEEARKIVAFEGIRAAANAFVELSGIFPELRMWE